MSSDEQLALVRAEGLQLVISVRSELTPAS